MNSECCIACYNARPKVEGIDGHTFGDVFFPTRGMIVCQVCGNKRCPKATDHNNACSGSNDPGQYGSIYGIVLKGDRYQGSGRMDEYPPIDPVIPFDSAKAHEMPEEDGE